MTPKSFTDLHKNHQGKVSDKWSFYLDQYELLFNPLRDKTISLLEIGIQNGGSLEVWSKYFPRAKVFMGCDIDKKCSKLTFQDPRINLVIGDANQQKIQKEVIQKGGPFDIVIDDGSHRSGDIIKSFVNYFPHLAENGVYVIEGLHCSYWEHFEGGLFAPYSSMTFFKQLTDLLNYEHWGVSKDYTEILKGFSVVYDLKLKQDVLEKIKSIEFFNSMCVIRKSSGKTSELGLRIVTGKVNAVSDAKKKINLTKSIPPSQVNNVFSARKLPPAEDVIDLYKQIQIQETKIQTQETKIQTQETKIQIQKNLLNLMINSRSWTITKPLRFIKNKIGVLALFLKYENYIKFFDLLIRYGLLNTLKIIKFKTSSNVNYDDWIKSYDNFNRYNKKRANKEIKNFKSLPLFSIVMPTYNSNIAWLKSAIESVQNQIYPNWELCIADDASTNKNVEATLREFMAKDKRIKVVFRKKNGHISEASNSAVNLANGDWVGFLDHDDIMAPHALYNVAKVINSHSKLKIIYSDEDKIDIKNKRSGPYFKPDWNEDLFLSHNLLTHLVMYRHDLIKKIGGFRTEFNGAQDYDLALRCIEVINSKEIFHIPHILYHWRMHDLSTAKSHKAKPYAMLAGEKALNEHFIRMKIKAKAEHLNMGYRVSYALPKKLPLVSLIIPTRNGMEVFKKCMESILSRTTYSNYEIIIVDNGSDDQKILKYMNELSLKKNISLIKDARDFNYSALNNLGVSVSRGSIIGLINNDIEVISPDWLSEMVSHAIRKGVGAVGAKLYYPDNTIQHAGVILGLGGYASHSHRCYPKDSFGSAGRLKLIQSYSAVTGACLLIKKSIYQEVGGLDEEKFKVAYNDIDFCLKVLRKGYKNIWTPYAELYHYESASRGHNVTSEKKARFNLEKFYLRKKWNSYIKHDPAYNPNLTLDREDFSLAWPPRI